jgi:hypothetical protein
MLYDAPAWELSSWLARRAAWWGQRGSLLIGMTFYS